MNASVNVNKLLFGEMKLAEREREKHAFQMSKQMGKEQCSSLILLDLFTLLVNHVTNTSFL